MINAIESVNPNEFITPLRPNALPTDASAAAGTDFSQMVTNGLQAVNQQLLVSQTDLQSLAMGNTENLHQIMIRLEESKMSFQLMMQIRNRMLEAYQDVMKMSV